jgi:Na+/pantothenate symporter
VIENNVAVIIPLSLIVYATVIKLNSNLWCIYLFIPSLIYSILVFVAYFFEDVVDAFACVSMIKCSECM